MIKIRHVVAILLMSSWLITGCTGWFAGASPTPTPALDAPRVPGSPDEFKIGIVIFLSGGAAAPFGIPARDGAEAMIASLNSGGAPAPYHTPGIAGVPIKAIYVDEMGGAEKQIEELKRLYQEEQVDLVIGYISSADCLAAAPVAEELEKLLVIFDCGTSRLFEEHSYQYVFRTNAHQAIDSLAGARYLLMTRPGAESVAGINQNYAWGQDSWAHFRDTLLKLKPGIEVLTAQFPKIDAGDYSAEIAALKQVSPQIIHTSFWGADLENLVAQARSAGLDDESTLLMSVGEYALPGLGNQIPPGTIIGAHGPHGIMAPPGPLNTWLVDIYRSHYNARPTYPVYHMAQALLGVKMAYEQAVAAQGGWPAAQQVIQSFEYLEFSSPSGTIRMAIGNGHQAVEPAVYGTAGDYIPVLGEVEIVDMIVFPVACVNPPDGITTEAWIKDGFPQNNCP